MVAKVCDLSGIWSTQYCTARKTVASSVFRQKNSPPYSTVHIVLTLKKPLSLLRIAQLCSDVYEYKFLKKADKPCAEMGLPVLTTSICSSTLCFLKLYKQFNMHYNAVI